MRLWVTAFLGAIIGMLLLPWWQRLWGVDWLMAPAAVMMAAIFIALGWGMNRMGSYFITQQLKEAAVWERAGLIPETRSAFEQAAALFDSFWLSPARRKSDYFRISNRMARFYLGRPVLDAYSRSVLAAHLKSYAHDDAVAEGWLSHMLGIQEIFPEEYEAAASVGEALQDFPKIQWGLFQFYLKDGQTDFNALKVYRRICQQKSSLSEVGLSKLSRLLLDHAMLNDWCLRIYLKTYDTSRPECVEGLAAAVRWLPETVDNAADLAAAKKMVADLPQDRMDYLTRRFNKYSEMQLPGSQTSRRAPVNYAAGVDSLRRRATVLVRLAGRGSQGAIQSIYGFSRGVVVLLRQSGRFRKACIAGGVCFLMAWMGILAWRSRQNGPEENVPLGTPPVVEQLAPIVTDPFTIQVAAYLNPDDAKSYVEMLKGKGLDAFRTQATSARRVWYQVKVSHFPTKAQARQYGDQLKSKGLIDDFYVANYQRNE